MEKLLDNISLKTTTCLELPTFQSSVESSVIMCRCPGSASNLADHIINI